MVVTQASDLDQQSFAAARAEFDDARSFCARADGLVHEGSVTSGNFGVRAHGKLEPNPSIHGVGGGFFRRKLTRRM